MAENEGDEDVRCRDVDLPIKWHKLLVEWEIVYYGNYSPWPMYLDGRTGQLMFGRQYKWHTWPPPPIDGEGRLSFASQ